MVAQKSHGLASSKKDLDRAVSLLRAGEPVVFPTDTVYGVGVSVRHAASPDVVYQVKERSRKKPIAWLVGGADALDAYGDMVPDSARRLVERFWPGPLTVIVRASDAVPPAFASDRGTIGLRMPASETVQALVRALGCPVATSSANLAGNPSPRSFAEVDPVLLSRVPFALSDDTEKSGIASTVVDCSGGAVVMVREGALTAADIQRLA